VGRNFDAFYAYNASENYALAIAHLSQRIEQKNTDVNFANAWPTDDLGLSRKESREVQESLNLLGYNIGEVDGIIGDKTRQTIQKYQVDIGIKADGKAGKKIYQRLMASTSKLREAAKVQAKINAETKTAVNSNSQSTTQKPSDTKSSYGLSNLLENKTLLSILISLLIALSVAIFINRKRQ
jgi:peptidoglycan hydrolase-like protein with peptidoglycan-binding domain